MQIRFILDGRDFAAQPVERGIEHLPPQIVVRQPADDHEAVPLEVMQLVGGEHALVQAENGLPVTGYRLRQKEDKPRAGPPVTTTAAASMAIACHP